MVGGSRADNRCNRMSAAPPLRLYGLGLIMAASLFACAYIPGPVGGPPYLVCVGVAGLAYLLAIREFLQTPKSARHAVLICLALSALWRISAR